VVVVLVVLVKRASGLDLIVLKSNFFSFLAITLGTAGCDLGATGTLNDCTFTCCGMRSDLASKPEELLLPFFFTPYSTIFKSPFSST